MLQWSQFSNVAWTFVLLDFVWSNKRLGKNGTEKGNWKVAEHFVIIDDKYDKKNHQMQYVFHSSYDSAYKHPLTVRLKLHAHKSTRRKKLVKPMPDLGLCILCDKIIKIKNSIASSVPQRIKENNRVYIPSDIIRGVLIHFAIDNCDYKNDTHDGKNKFHDTAKVVIQRSTWSTSFSNKINRSANKFKRDSPRTEKITKPVSQNESFPAFNEKFKYNKHVKWMTKKGVVFSLLDHLSLISHKPDLSTC